VQLTSEPPVVNEVGEVGRNRQSSGVFRANGDRIELSRGIGEEKPVDAHPSLTCASLGMVMVKASCLAAAPDALVRGQRDDWLPWRRDARCS
jgi:hypothetical protein